MMSELSDMVDNLYKHARLTRSIENKPRYYGGDTLLYPNEVYTLRAVVQREGINQTELSEEMARTKGATSAVVQKLVQKGLVEQRAGEQDQRFTRLYPTEKGLKVCQTHLDYDMRYAEFLCQRLDLNLEQLAQANHVLRLMTNDLLKRIRLGENIMNDGAEEEFQEKTNK